MERQTEQRFKIRQPLSWAKRTGIALLAGAAGLTVGAWTHSVFAGAASGTENPQRQRYENRELFQKVIHFIETNYVDSVDNQKLIHGAIKGMLETLDPHSNFLPPELYKEMKVDTSGKFGGVGLEIGVKNNVLTVITPIEGTPAWKAGIKPGDRIIKIGGESTKGVSLSEAIAKMRGKKGTSVSVSVYREGMKQAKEYSLVRDLIKVQTVRSEELSAGYGWIKLANFNENAAKDIQQALGRLEKNRPLQGLVLDLRANPGGLLDQAVDVTSLFIDEGVIVSTVGKNKEQKEVKYAKKGMARKDLPLVVLVNSSSASAAEIVAGALQDHRRAIIMGQPTFGKGSVQTVIELAPEMGLKLTIARYYTPSGRSIQEKGVQPDLLVEDLDPKVLAEARRRTRLVREKDLKGHFSNSESSPDEFSREELETLGKKSGSGSSRNGEATEGANSDDDGEGSPMALNPKDDYQVQAALNYLRSFEAFKKIADFHRGDRTISSVSPSVQSGAASGAESDKE